MKVVLVLVLVVCLHHGVQSFPGWIKCGDGRMQAFLFRCCDGVKHPVSRLEPRTCCGKDTFRRDAHICCSGAVHKSVVGVSCCGKSVYDHVTQLCCNENVIAKADNAVPECMTA